MGGITSAGYGRHFVQLPRVARPYRPRRCVGDVGTWWWLAVGLIVAAALVAALVDGGARLGPRRRDRPPLPDAGPRPGELWWTHPPALVLVLEVGAESARVAGVKGAEGAEGAETSEETGGERESRDTGLPLPPGALTSAPNHPALLDPQAVRAEPLAAFRHRAGALAPDTWERARRATGDATGGADDADDAAGGAGSET